MPKSTAPKTDKFCREQLGWITAVAEFHHKGGFTVDPFGFCDVIAFVPGQPGVTLIQSTASGHGKDRIKKIQDHCREDAEGILACGNRIEIWDWRRYVHPEKSTGEFEHPYRWYLTKKLIPKKVTSKKWLQKSTSK